MNALPKDLSPELLYAIQNDPDLRGDVTISDIKTGSHSCHLGPSNEKLNADIRWKEKVTKRLNEDKKEIALLKNTLSVIDSQYSKTLSTLEARFNNFILNLGMKYEIDRNFLEFADTQAPHNSQRPLPKQEFNHPMSSIDRLNAIHKWRDWKAIDEMTRYRDYCQLTVQNIQLEDELELSKCKVAMAELGLGNIDEDENT